MLAADIWQRLESPQRKVRELAARELEAARPEAIQPYTDAVLGFMPRVEDWIVRSRWCLVVTRLRLTEAERAEAFQTARSFLGDRSGIVRTFAMQTMFHLAQQEPAFLDDVADVLNRAAATGTKAMKARARLLLKKLTPQAAHPRTPGKAKARGED